MDWMQFSTFMFGNMAFTLTLWLWARAESRADFRLVLSMIDAIKQEMKDFHTRLCSIEERNKEK